MGDYLPHRILRNGHINTVYPTFFRSAFDITFERMRIDTPDDDFLDLDILKLNQTGVDKCKRVAILCHGLEGSSSSKYIIGTASILNDARWDVVAMNYRGCSGVINNQARMYHSGATYDLETVIKFFEEDYEEIHLVGYSLGGNLVLKYSGERNLKNSKIKSVVAISTPTNLKAGSLHLNKKSNFFYAKRFLQTLKQKVIAKHRQFPDLIELDYLKKVKTIYDFDDFYTGPFHGFNDADDYYSRCSSAQFLPTIKIPGLIINAVDDPFLPIDFYPFEEVEMNKNLMMLAPKYGGHVGFVQMGEKYYWEEEKIRDFLNEKSEV